MSEQKTFTIAGVATFEEVSREQGWSMRLASGASVDPMWILCDAHAEALDEIEQYKEAVANAKRQTQINMDALQTATNEIDRLKAELRHKADMLTSMVMSNGIPARLIRTDAEAAMASAGQCLAKEVEWLRVEVVRLNNKIGNLERSLAIASAQVTDIPVRLPDPRVHVGDGYEIRFADDTGPMEDRGCDVYYRDEYIGSAPDRPSARALIERHKVEMVSAAQRRTQESRQGQPVESGHDGPKDGPSKPEVHVRERGTHAGPWGEINEPVIASDGYAQASRPAGLSDEERTMLRADIKILHVSNLHLSILRRIVEALP